MIDLVAVLCSRPAMAAIFAILVTGVTSAGFAADSSQSDIGTGNRQKLVKGVDSLKWENGQNTYIASLAAALRARAEKISYTDLMGLSGAAFRLQYYLPYACPSSPDATCGYDCSKPALKAMGYIGHHDGIGENAAEETKRIRNAITGSIDRGYPVIGIELIGPADWGVITGYAGNGEELLCRTFHNRKDPDEKTSNCPWAITILDEKRKAPDLKDSFRKSLEIAVMLAKTSKFDAYASGYAAYEAWQKHLRESEWFAAQNPGDFSSAMHTNAWIYVSLLDARIIAEDYLRRHLDLLGAPASMHLTKAAGLYKEEAALLDQGHRYVHFPWELKEGQGWSQSDRDREAKVLEKAMAIDRAAIAEIEKVLTGSK